MQENSIVLAERPAHVPSELVVDWDFYNPPGAQQDLIGAWKSLHSGPPIIWTPHNGGHWIVTRAEDIEYIQRHYDPFSMRKIMIPADITPKRMLPIEADPPEHTGYRTIINQFFTPRALKGLQEGARDLAIELIEGFKHNGRCEFRKDFAMQLPIIVFMRMVDQPLDNLDHLLVLAEKAARPKSQQDMMDAFAGITAYIAGIIGDRRANPRDDLLSAVVNAQVDGETITSEDAESMMINLLFGGLDTVAATLGFAARFLADNPDKRQELLDRPELIPNAVDELLRMFAPSSTGRRMSRDFDYKGVTFKQGEMVYVRGMLHSMDEAKFENPMEADWERPGLERNYASFGNGPHRCPGATLARSELRIFIEEWLARIPHFRCAPGEHIAIGTGMVNSVLHLPLIWDTAIVR